jgi:hypothetical protein
MPIGLRTKALNTAKKSAEEGLKGKAGDKAKQKAIEYFEQKKISIQQIETYLGVTSGDNWTTANLMKLRGAYRAIKDNVIPLSKIFAPEITANNTVAVQKEPKPPAIPAKAETPAIPESPPVLSPEHLTTPLPKQESLVPEETVAGAPTENQKEREAEWRLQELELEYPDLSKRFIRALQGKPASLIVKEIEASAKQQEEKYTKDKAPSRTNSKKKISF